MIFEKMKFGKYILLAAVAGLAGCLGDKSAVCPDKTGDNGAVTITMSLPRITGGTATRSTVDEIIAFAEDITSSIETVDLLLINTADKTIKWHMTLWEFNFTRQDDYFSFKVNLSEHLSAGEYKIILIANANDQVCASLWAADHAGNYTETAFMNELKNTIGNETEYTVPMWGETGKFDGYSSDNIPTVQMIRSLSLGIVDVDASLADVFEITGIHQINGYQQYLIAPWKGGGAYNYSHAERKVTAPSIPVGNPKDDMKNGGIYEDLDKFTIAFTEQDNASSKDEFMLVIRAGYGPEGNRKEGYYKVCFRDRDGERFDILRNHCYVVRVTGVTGPGYATWQEAVENHSFLQVQIDEWNTVPQNVIFDNDYYLEVSHPKLDLYAEAGYVTMKFKTNFPKGDEWKTSLFGNVPPGVVWEWIGGQPEWLRYEGEVESGIPYERTLKIIWEKNDTGVIRSAAIRVIAGNMNYIINIIQSYLPWLEADDGIAPFDGLFHEIFVNSQLDWTVSYETEEGNITPDGVDVITKSSKESILSVFFRTQYRTEDDIYHVVKLTFKNTEYNYTPVESHIVVGPVKGESNCYMVRPNACALIPVSRANVWKETSEFPYPLPIEENHIVNWKMIWQDKQGISQSSNIQQIRVFGKGYKAYLLVRAGSAQGNAVIAATTKKNDNDILQIPIEEEDGVVRWSWHFWVTDYDPYYAPAVFDSPMEIGVTTMDRNLGALRGDPGTSPNLNDWKLMRGLYYQWGRKDAFPPDVDIWSGDVPVAIDAGTIDTSPLKSIMYPLRPSKNSAWNGFDGNKSWGSYNKKSVHDPCPEGWKVPYYEYWGRNNTNPEPIGNLVDLGAAGATFDKISPGGQAWMEWTEYGGYFPAQGVRIGSTFAMTNINPGVGYLWTAQEASNYNKVRFSFTTANESGTSKPYHGMPVRCVVEYDWAQ